MNIIERAGRQLSLKSSKSVVERAAERLASVPGSTATPIAPPRVAAIENEGQSPAKGSRRRETQRHVTLDFDRLRAAGFSLPGDQSVLAEEFRLIKRPLLQTALAPPPSARNANVIMVTSAHPNEGKTFVAANLAFSLASEHDLHVLLIDADFPNPAMSTLFGFEAKTGLMDLVSDSAVDFSDVAIRTNIANLMFIASGPAKPGSSELLASGRMTRFVDEVSTRYSDRIIIFDASPVLARSEPMVLAKHVGQVVLVMEAERTSRTALEEAIGLIGAERIAGVVLNKAPPVARDQFGTYYGSYGRS